MSEISSTSASPTSTSASVPSHGNRTSSPKRNIIIEILAAIAALACVTHYLVNRNNNRTLRYNAPQHQQHYGLGVHDDDDNTRMSTLLLRGGGGLVRESMVHNLVPVKSSSVENNNNNSHGARGENRGSHYISIGGGAMEPLMLITYMNSIEINMDQQQQRSDKQSPPLQQQQQTVDLSSNEVSSPHQEDNVELWSN